MELVFLRSFIQDFKATREPAVRRKVERAVKQLQQAVSLKDIPNLRKLEGYRNAYRIRIGDHRIGFLLVDGKIELQRLANRRDIYRSFP